MLVELAVKNLGVIESARIPFGDGLVALTGETGAGKTMLVEALNLLSGQKADPSRVRVGSDEAVVEALFVDGDDEFVLRRVVPVSGRSKAYLNGELATAATLAEVAGDLLEMHGQHAQQQLFSARAHRDALDEFAGIDTTDLARLKAELRLLRSEIDASGGDERSRARELSLLEFQVEEIDAAQLRIGEDADLASEEETLGDALGHVEAAENAGAQLGSDGAAMDQLSGAMDALKDRSPYAGVLERLVGLRAELSDCTDEIRRIGESIEPDPQRLAILQERRALIAELRRKYGETEEMILDFADETRRRVGELRSHDARLAELQQKLDAADTAYRREAERVGALRRRSASKLAASIESRLQDLAMSSAHVEIRVADSSESLADGADVEFLISTNPGVSPGPLAKVASGGELSRVMLALRLVLTHSPPTTVFDEIDAGIGGETAVEVGRLLAQLSRGQQVLVVTHLPQVAAYADHQVLISKSIESGAAETTAVPLDRPDRVVEISRMISGSPDSDSARIHAEELLDRAVAERRPRAS